MNHMHVLTTLLRYSVGSYKEKHQCSFDHALPSQAHTSVFRIFQRVGGRIDSRQLCYCLRAVGWNDGLWLSTNDRDKDLARVRDSRGLWLCSLFAHLDQRYITQDAYKLEVQVRPPMAVTNAVSWRSEGIKYKKNEVFLDVIESVNLLVWVTWTQSWIRFWCSPFFDQVNANGNVLRSEVLGAVKMRCYLSGMPELRLGLNDKVMFEATGRGMYAASK